MDDTKKMKKYVTDLREYEMKENKGNKGAGERLEMECRITWRRLTSLGPAEGVNPDDLRPFLERIEQATEAFFESVRPLYNTSHEDWKSAVAGYREELIKVTKTSLEELWSDKGDVIDWVMRAAQKVKWATMDHGDLFLGKEQTFLSKYTIKMTADAMREVPQAIYEVRSF